MTKKTIAICIILTMIITPYSNTVLATSNPTVYSESVILIDGDSGQVLYDKNANIRQYPASITKVLTAIVAVENNELDEVVEVSEDVPYEIESGSSSIYLLPGEKLTINELLYALMVESANDAAVAIAEHTSGSVEEFADLMNKKAKEIGATNSNFVNPHGLHDANHYVTAKDMALIMKEAMKNPLLQKLMITPNYVIPETNKQQTRYLWTKNKLFKSKSSEYYYDPVIASKTGFTTIAGNTLVSLAQKDDMNLITVVLNANGTESYKDTISLFEYGFNNFTPSKIIGKNELIKDCEVKGAVNSLQLVSRGDVTYLAKKDESKDIESKIQIEENLPSSIKKGDKVGKAVYSLGENKIAEVELVAGNDVISKTSVKLAKLKEYILWIASILLLAYIIIRICVHIKNVKIRRRKIRRNYGIKYNDNYSKRRKKSNNGYYRF